MIISLHAATGFAPVDSVGVEEVNGKKFILHKVDEKETLYSLSRRYNVSINQITEHNPSAEFGLPIGQVIRVPLLQKEKPERPENPSPSYVSVKENIHIVKPKETVFSISRMYNVSIEDLKQWNNLTSNMLEIDQRLIIKENIESSSTANKPETKVTNRSSGKRHHVVEPKETLYSISKKYNVGIDELRDWNSLIGNEISIGQELIVAKGASGTEVAQNNSETKTTTPPDDIKDIGVVQEKAPSESGNTVSGPLIGEGGSTSTVGSEKPITNERTTNTFEEIQESGIAELIEGSENSRKYLALHRSAKPGTIIRVRNSMNDQEVFVRVLGKLPDTGVNKNVLIKISKSAYDRLGAIDPKFRVTVSYIP